MKRTYVFVIIVETVIILMLLFGMAVVVFYFYGSKPRSALPVMPTYDPAFSTVIPVSTEFPTPIIANPAPSASATATSLPILTVNGTPVYPTAVYVPPPPVATIPPATGKPPVRPTCRNILYPVASGQQWSYQANARGRIVNMDMSVLSVNGSQGNVLINHLPLGATKQVQVQCEGDIIRSFPFMSVDVLLGNAISSNLTASYISGVLAPNEAAFLNSNWALAWSSHYMVSGTTSLDYNGRQLDIILNNSPITLTCQTLGVGDAAFETVRVAAGIFRALKVVCSEQGPITATVNGIPISGTANGRSYQWFALNIGLVKMQVEYATLDLLGISVSLVTDNYLELINYIPAP
jgi:hypothetical protein